MIGDDLYLHVIKKGYWILLVIISLILFVFKISWYIILVTDCLIVLIMYIFKKNDMNKNQNLKYIKNISSEKSKITIGIMKDKKINKYFLVDKKNVLFIDKQQNSDFLNTNIKVLANFKNKPILFVIDSDNEFYTTNNKFLREQGYDIVVVNLEKINFNVLDIVNQLFLKIKQLEENVHNNLGKYFLNEDIYLSYDEVSKRITKLKKQIVAMCDEIIHTFYCYDKLSEISVLLRCIFLRIIEEWWDGSNKNTLKMKMLLEKTIQILKKNTCSIKRYLYKSYDDDFKIREEIEKLKIRNDKLERYFKIINDKSMELIPKFEYDESILLEQRITNKQAFFIHGNNKELSKLIISFFQYCNLSTDAYLLINSDEIFLTNLENLRVLWVVNQVKENQEYDNFEIKVFRDNQVIDSKKDLLLICKNEINGILTKEYNKVFNLLEKFDSLDTKNGEVLVIDDKYGYLKTKFITDAIYQNIALNENILIKKYKKEI